MRNNMLRNRSGIVRGGITLVLLLTLFTMMSFTAFAQDQSRQGLRAGTVPSLQSAPSGRADLEWNAQSKALTVIFHLSGLQPGSVHAAHIHAGTCASKEQILYPFENIVADESGNVLLTETVTDVTGGIPTTGWNITVHNGSVAQTGTLLCGNVVNPEGATSVTVPLY